YVLADIVLLDKLIPVVEAAFPGSILAIAMKVCAVAIGGSGGWQIAQCIGDSCHANGAKDAIVHKECQCIDGINVCFDACIVKRLAFSCCGRMIEREYFVDKSRVDGWLSDNVVPVSGIGSGRRWCGCCGRCCA